MRGAYGEVGLRQHRPIMRGVIVALDLPDAESAVQIAETVAEHVVGFQIGPGLLYGPGPLVIPTLVALDRPVLVDAKLHDDPGPVEEAAYRLGRYGARWVTAHVGGGRDMLAAAARGLKDGSGDAPAGILGVTVLSSLDRAELASVGIDRSPGKLVARRAKVAAGAGCEGVMAPLEEVSVVAEATTDLLRVTYGPDGADGDESQREYADLDEAIRRGADMLLVGRPITRASDPAAAAEALSSRVHGSATGA